MTSPRLDLKSEKPSTQPHGLYQCRKSALSFVDFITITVLRNSDTLSKSSQGKLAFFTDYSVKERINDTGDPGS